MFKKIAAASGAGLRAFGRAVPTIIRDLVGVAAVGLIAYGAWLLNPAAGFITGGTLLLVGVYLVSAQTNRGSVV
jgi:hypothetical protein